MLLPTMIIIIKNNQSKPIILPCQPAPPAGQEGECFLPSTFTFLGGPQGVTGSKFTKYDFLVVKRENAFRGSRWRFHLRGSGRAFSSSGLARGVSRSASAYDSVRLEHAFSVRRRFLVKFVCASVRCVFVFHDVSTRDLRGRHFACLPL